MWLLHPEVKEGPLTPFSTGVYQNEEPSPEGQRDKDISLSQFILSMFDNGGGSSSLEILKVCSCADPGSSQLGTPVAKRCCRDFLEVYRVNSDSTRSDRSHPKSF